ncbi:CDP-glucose 4,6-dehydratase [Methylobacterium brachiatum]
MIAIDPAFWQGRRVFLTGHTGLKGGWCVLALKALGAEIHGYALAPETPGLYEAAKLDALMASSTIADLSERARLETALTQSRAELVLHMAAQPLVRASYSDPVQTYMTNVMGTAYVLEAVRRSSTVNAAICVTSDKCYENREWLWGYREDEPMGGYDPYSSSKGCAELLISSWRRSFFAEGAAVASVRAGNVVGGGDWSADRIVPDLVRAARSNSPAAIRNPGAIRPWQHALEAVVGYLLLAQHLSGPQGRDFAAGWNFGPNAESERTVREVADTLAHHYGLGMRWELDGAPAPHEAGYLKLDSSKARRILNWIPKWDFEETMRVTAEWYRRDAEGVDPREICREQLERFMSS